MGRVTETIGNSATLENHDTPAGPVRDGNRSNRLYRALALVGIAAGSVFIIATVFFSGYVLGQQGDDGPRHGPPHRVMLKPFPGPDGPMGPGGPMGPDDGPRAERLTPPSPPSPPSSIPSRP
jgi:hypothetical protein